MRVVSDSGPALVDVARSAGVSVASSQGGWLTKSALVEALVSALSSAASVSSASSSRSAADAFLAELRDMVQQLPGDAATSLFVQFCAFFLLAVCTGGIFRGGASPHASHTTVLVKLQT